MKTMTRLFFALGLIALIGVAFGAQNEKKEKKGKGRKWSGTIPTGL